MRPPVRSINDVMEYFLSNHAQGLPLEAISELFCRIAWITPDNGEELVKELRKWLNSDDPTKIEIALKVDEFFIYPTHQEMNECLNKIRVKFPQFSELCDNILLQMSNQRIP